MLLSGALLLIWQLGTADVAHGAVQTGNKEVVQIGQTEQNENGLREEAVVRIVDVTNLRSGAGIEYEIVGKAKPGETYPVLGSLGEWYYVSLPEGGTAYVAGWVVNAGEGASGNLCSPGNSTRTNLEVITDKDAFVRFDDNTNLRNGPGLEFDIIAKAKSGDAFPVVGSEGEWVIVQLSEGATAYVAGWVVKIDSPGRSTESNQQECKSVDSRVYIYHTHNLESWKNVASQTRGSSVDDPEVNITLVGAQIAEQLKAKGIFTTVAKDDFANNLKVKKLSYTKSYSESRKAVDKARSENSKLQYFFDVHRDANVPRSKTTATIGKKTYARILFVIGTGHANHKENKKFAEALNALLNKKYPGLSRGVLLKSAHQGNGEYNQSVSSGSLLLEIGGVNNTLEESLLTAKAFADVFAEYYSTAKPINKKESY